MAQNHLIGLRRLRQDRWIRELVREHQPRASQFVQPLFVVEGLSAREQVPGLTGVFRETRTSLLQQIEADLESGVRKFLLFGVPGERRDSGFKADWTAGSIEAIKRRFGQDLWLSVDVCLCSHTTHGHCGILSPEGDHVENDATVEALAATALAYAQAGADCVAPSDMMDGRIRAIRERLDHNAQDRTLLLSYAAKFHSRFYGPFRVAADSAPKGELKLKDRASYQIDPGNSRDALRCARRDADEGADLLMVKPALPYLDVLSELAREIPLPWFAYEVSGEYAAIELLAKEGLIDARAGHLEAWTGLVRAGASAIISYGARNARLWLEESP